MTLLTGLILISSLSFFYYGIAFFIDVKLRSEFSRFGIRTLGPLVAVLEILGALGLVIGIKINFILLLASGGLFLLMLLGVLVRLKVKDTLWMCLPAAFFMVLNAYIFVSAFPDNIDFSLSLYEAHAPGRTIQSGINPLNSTTSTQEIHRYSR